MEAVVLSFQQRCAGKGIKISLPMAPAPAPPQELNAFQKACQENGIRVLKPEGGENLKMKVNVKKENSPSISVKMEPKSPLRVIDTEFMFNKACNSKGIRISKPEGVDGGAGAVEVESGEKRKGIIAADNNRGAVSSTEPNKTVTEKVKAKVELNISFDLACKNIGIRLSAPSNTIVGSSTFNGKKNFSNLSPDPFVDGTISALREGNKPRLTYAIYCGDKGVQFLKPVEVGSGTSRCVIPSKVCSESSTKSPSGPFTSFTIFPELPYELKTEVWKNIIFPRIIICDDRESQTKGPSAANKAPAILHACQQSREVGLKAYTKIVIVGSPWPRFPSPNNTDGRIVYVDYENDIFHSNARLAHPERMKADSIHTTAVLRPSWSQRIQHFSLDLETAYKYLRRLPHSFLAFTHHLPISIVDTVYPDAFVFRTYFPHLQELIVMVTLHARSVNREELSERQRRFMSPSDFNLFRQMDEIKDRVKSMQTSGDFPKLKLTFKKQGTLRYRIPV